MKKAAIFCISIILLLTGCKNNYTEISSDGSLSAEETQKGNIQKSESNNSDSPNKENTPHVFVSEESSLLTSEKPKSETEKAHAENNLAGSSPPNRTEDTKPGNNSSGNNSVQPNPDIADESDEERIEKRVIELFNTWRRNQLVYLPGLTKYDRYRSEQLVSNFEHDESDIRKAANALKYGEHIIMEESYYDFERDEEIYTGRILDYYQVNAMEAIGRGGVTYRSPEEVAMEIAEGFQNSKGHWSYLGSDEYSYVGCGVTVKDGKWYCCISVARTNTDENPGN